jgi:hypothetical protein
MITPTEAKQRETEIQTAVDHLNELIRSSYEKGVSTRLYIDGSWRGQPLGVYNRVLHHRNPVVSARRAGDTSMKIQLDTRPKTDQRDVFARIRLYPETNEEIAELDCIFEVFKQPAPDELGRIYAQAKMVRVSGKTSFHYGIVLEPIK